ncbi:hypothetical protein LINGRAHAP2_LOCUS34589 [Linum grandiflorum]
MLFKGLQFRVNLMEIKGR